ncbi:MAG: YceI family protein [Rhodothermales bacterium]
MKNSPVLSILVLSFILIAATWSADPTQMTITPESRMWVDGTSTVHDWTCDVGEVDGNVTLDAETGAVSKAAVTVASSSIECDSRTMNRKVAEALAIDDFPVIRYTLSTADVMSSGEELRIDAVGTLELAGASKEMSSSLVGQPASEGGYVFTGTLPITMSTFDIDPPTAMFGALKTGDDVTVRFEIYAVPGSGRLSSGQ